jgi:hypothetical protein
VYNFQQAHRPQAISLPAGKGNVFRADMGKLVEDLRTALPAAFESEEYQTRRQVISEELQERQSEALEDLQQGVRNDGLALIRTPAGFPFAPVQDGDVLSPEQIQELPDEERSRLPERVQHYQEELQGVLRQVPSWQRERRQKVEALDRQMAGFAVSGLIDELRAKYADHAEVVAHLDAAQKDLIENARDLIPSEDQGGNPLAQALTGGGGRQARDSRGDLRRYEVNVVVDHAESKGAPVVYEDNPT